MGVRADDLLQLYALVSDAPCDRFGARAFAFLRKYYAFDTAFWCNARADLASGEVVPTAVHLEGLDAGFLLEWAREVEVDPVLYQAHSHPGQAQRISIDATYAELEGARTIFRQGQIRSYSCTLLEGFKPGEIQFVSLYRRQPLACDDVERAAFETLLPHMRLAWQLNLALNEASCDEQDGLGWCVAEQSTGAIVRSQAGFMRAIDADFAASRREGLLPGALIRPGSDGAGVRFTARSHVYQGRRMAGFIFLAASRCAETSRLTPRQYEVARHYAAGMTHKEVARVVGVAPSTVRNLLAAAFERLQVSSRTDLARRLEMQ